MQTDYLDGFQYKYTEPSEDESGTMTTAQTKLRIIPTSEGYYDALLNLYVYNYTDHLGNVRISYADSDHDGNIKGRDERIKECWGGNCVEYFIPGEIVSNNTYYPFGMLLENHNFQATSSNAYKYKYNGKELQETGMFDYGWRHYMADIGRWNGIDQLAEMYQSTSTYAYVANNPVLRFDVDGRWFNDDGTIDTSGRTKSFTSGKQYRDSFLGVNRNDGSGGGGSDWGQSFTSNSGPTVGNLIDAWVDKIPTDEILSLISNEVNNLLNNENDFDLNNNQQRKEPWDLNGDGRLDLDEATNWYRTGKGKTVTLDASKIDLNSVDTSKWIKGQAYGVQTLLTSRDGRVLGNITVKYLGNNQVSILTDTYNFEQHGSFIDSPFRNAATVIGAWKAGKGIQYKINFKGINTIIPTVYKYETGPKY